MKNTKTILIENIDNIVNESILIFDDEGKIQFISENLLNYLDIFAKNPNDINLFKSIRKDHPLFDPLKRSLKSEKISFDYLDNGSSYHLQTIHMNESENIPGYTIASIKNDTQEKLAEEAFINLEKQYEAFFNNCHFPLYIFDLGENNSQLQILKVNDQLIKTLGYSSEELLNSDPRNFDETLNLFYNHLIERLLAEKQILYETRLMPKAGEHFIVEVTDTLLSTDKKKMVLCGIKELSVLQKSDKTVHEAITNYKNLKEIWPDGLIIHQDLVIVSANEIAVKILGASSKEEIIGRSILDLLPEKYHKEIIERADVIIKDKIKPPPLEIILTDRDGKTAYYEIIEAYHRYKMKPCILATIRDISDKVKIQSEMLNRKKYLESILEWVPLAVIATNLDDKVTEWNLGAEALFGYTKFESMNKNLYQLIVRPDVIDEAKNFSRIIKSKDFLESIETIRYHKNNSPINVLLSAAPIYRDDQIEGIVYIYKDLALIKQIEIELKNSHGILRETLIEISASLAGALELRDPYTSGHGKSVSLIAKTIAEILGWEEDRILGIELAGLLHDIGKLGVPIEILTKPTKLNSYELELIKEHTTKGYEILKSIPFPFPLAEAVLQHHERLNGSGYPNKLKGKDIILEAKILAVSDVVDAMCSHRPYRPARDINYVIKELEEGAGCLFDKKIVDIILDRISKNNYQPFWIDQVEAVCIE